MKENSIPYRVKVDTKDGKFKKGQIINIVWWYTGECKTDTGHKIWYTEIERINEPSPREASRGNQSNQSTYQPMSNNINPLFKNFLAFLLTLFCIMLWFLPLILKRAIPDIGGEVYILYFPVVILTVLWGVVVAKHYFDGFKEE